MCEVGLLMIKKISVDNLTKSAINQSLILIKTKRYKSSKKAVFRSSVCSSRNETQLACVFNH